MKKTNNKGFSLVELIIVIAILAILAGAIAPALIRFIDKGRRSNDISTAKTISSAIETALGNEKAYELLVPTAAAGVTTIYLTNNNTTEASLLTALPAIPAAGSRLVAADRVNIANDIWKSLRSKSPRVKFNKWGQNAYAVVIDANGNVKVFIVNGTPITAAIANLAPGAANAETNHTTAANGTYWLVTPDVNDFYQ